MRNPFLIPSQKVLQAVTMVTVMGKENTQTFQGIQDRRPELTLKVEELKYHRRPLVGQEFVEGRNHGDSGRSGPLLSLP